MKKITLSIILLLGSFGFIFSQESGNSIVGGNINIIHSTLKDGSDIVSETSVSFGLSYAKMIGNKVAIGISLDAINYYDNIEKYGLYLGPLVRIHNNITDNFKPYVEPNIGITLIEGSESNFNAGINFGFVYFVSKKICFDINFASLNFIWINLDDEISYDYFSIEYNIVSPQIGLKYYF